MQQTPETMLKMFKINLFNFKRDTRVKLYLKDNYHESKGKKIPKCVSEKRMKNCIFLLLKNVCIKLLNDTCIECSTVMHHMLLVSFKHVHSILKLFIWCTIDVDFNINEHTLKRLLEQYFKSCHTLMRKMKTTQLESERIP